MNQLRNLPVSGLIVILIILCLFVLSVFLLLIVYGRYRGLSSRATGNPNKAPNVLRHAYNNYVSAYENYGTDINTPAIVEEAVSAKLSGLLLCERFLNSSVSLFVTLGLFGTFLGLSLSVQSLTTLLAGTNSSEWLSVLDNVGSGLLSSLSGMGVAFYTSLVGVACSIVLTILRSIMNPESARARMETCMEMWLDNEIAPTLSSEACRDDAELIKRMIKAFGAASSQIETSINAASSALIKVSGDLEHQLNGFDSTVGKFNTSVHDFSEVDYNLRGTIERMDLSIRDLRTAVADIKNVLEGSSK